VASAARISCQVGMGDNGQKSALRACATRIGTGFVRRG
jgi:hypothetical protein